MCDGSVGQNIRRMAELRYVIRRARNDPETANTAVAKTSPRAMPPPYRSLSQNGRLIYPARAVWTRVASSLILLLVAVACRGGHGSKCAKNEDCRRGLVCFAPTEGAPFTYERLEPYLM